MASVDGARSLIGASDESYELECGPCKTHNANKEANHYCKECNEYLCNACNDSHGKLRISKDHKVLSGSEMPRVFTNITQQTSFTLYCSCYQYREVEFFCEDHDKAMCSSCKTVKHRKCKSVSLQEKCCSYTTTRLSSVLQAAKTVKTQIDQLQHQRNADSREFICTKDACKTKISTFREEMNTFLDKLEQRALIEIDKYEKEQMGRINHHIVSITTALQMIESDLTLLEDAKKSNKKMLMYISDIKVSENLKEYEALITDLQRDALTPVLSFERNYKLVDMQSDVQTLGTVRVDLQAPDALHIDLQTLGTLQTPDTVQTDIQVLGALQVSDTIDNQRDKKPVLGMKVQSSNQVNVKIPDEGKKPYITGCCFMPNGQAALCDRNNSRIKTLDSSWRLKENLILFAAPWDLSVVDDCHAIITLPNEKKLQILQVLPQMMPGRTIQLDRECWGIDVSGCEIYTTCYEVPSWRGEVRVLDLNGNWKRSIGINLDGSFMFNTPLYVSVNPSSRKIFVSDSFDNTVTCMTLNGDVLSQYSDRELQTPWGLFVDGEDNVVVCSRYNSSLQVITADGRKYRALVSRGSHGITSPYSIAYRASDCTLMVGCRGSSHLYYLKLA